MRAVGFLGPAYTFGERAAKTFAAEKDLVGFDSIGAMYDGLVAGTLNQAVSPFENSAAGYVPQAIEAAQALIAPLSVDAERIEEIRFSLYRRKGDESGRVRRVASHIMSLKQCHAWLDAHHLEGEEATSNGTAFLQVRNATETGLAAIGPSGLSDPAMIEVETNIQGTDPNTTRFLLLSRARSEARIRAALCATDDIAKLATQLSPDRLQVCAVPAPRGHLGQYDTVAEIRFAQARALSDIGHAGGRILLMWGERG